MEFLNLITPEIAKIVFILYWLMVALLSLHIVNIICNEDEKIKKLLFILSSIIVSILACYVSIVQLDISPSEKEGLVHIWNYIVCNSSVLMPVIMLCSYVAIKIHHSNFREDIKSFFLKCVNREYK